VSVYNRTYGCFLFIGLYVLLVSLLDHIPMGNGVAGGIGFLVLIPLSILSLVAFAVGVFGAVQLRHSRVLPFLAVLTSAFLVLVVTDPPSAMMIDTASWLVGGLTTAIALTWFLHWRKAF